jgi:glyoxylase-like metal-dependent hydrolase (beta-lactamase superfamily II)
VSPFRVLPVRTPTLPPATHTNVYQLGDTVVDPASPAPEEQARVAAWATGARRILLTHAHADHVGGVVALARATGAEVWAHADCAVPFPVHRRIEDGEVLDTGAGGLEALHTPGHARGHLAFRLVGTGEVIAGDLVAGEGTIVLVPPEGDLQDYLDSLARVRALAERLWPAHGPAQPATLADAYVAHRHHRTAQFEAVLALGEPVTAEAIAGSVYAGLPGVNLMLAALQVETHLAWLQARGRARAVGGAWVAA